MKNKTRYLTLAAVIAALYVVLTYLSALFGLSGQNLVQVRLSEALCILPYFTSAAVPGVTLGCLIANLLTGAHALDIVFGTLATLLGAVGTRMLRKWRFLAPLPPILANTVIVPFVLRYAYLMVDIAMPILFLTVGIGEILSVGVLGTVLLLSLQKREKQIFGSEGRLTFKEK
jgi:uncharacterized membrane protein